LVALVLFSPLLATSRSLKQVSRTHAADGLHCRSSSECSAELGLWFSWFDPFDIVTAWRKVGLAGNRLDPDLICRDNCIDRDLSGTVEAAPVSAPSMFDEFVRMPEDMRGTTRVARLEKKLELAREDAEQRDGEHRLEKRRRISEPESYGLLPVPQHQVQPPAVDYARLDCANGSMSLRDMHKLHTELQDSARAAEAERQRKADGTGERSCGRGASLKLQS
jgi:hypothetical protein